MKWVYTFQRELPLTLLFMASEGYTKEMMQQIGWSFKNTLFVSTRGIEKSYRGEEDERSFREFIQARIRQDPAFILEVKEKMRRYAQECRVIFEQIKNENLVEKTNKQLLQLYKKAHVAELHLDSVFQFPVYLELFGGLGKEEILSIQEMTRVRDASSKLYYDAYRKNYYALFTEIAKRFETTPQLVKCMTPYEIFDTLEKEKLSVSQQVLKQRFEFNVLITKNGKTKLLVGKKARKLLEKEVPETFVEKINELVGKCACPGKAAGTARIILGESDLHKIKQGDIIVSSMTTVTFIPYLRKVSAIVTDEGGVTSHAALISLELKKPCVIGTKFATRWLKDGERIEVDAERGIVKKI